MRSYLHRSLFSSLNTALRSTSEFMFEQRLFIIPDMVRHTYKSDTLKRVHLKSRSCGSVWCLFYELEDRRNARLCKDLLRSYSISKWAAPVSNSSGRMTEGGLLCHKKGVNQWSSYQLFLSCGCVQAWSQFCTRQAASREIKRWNSIFYYYILNMKSKLTQFNTDSRGHIYTQ